MHESFETENVGWKEMWGGIYSGAKGALNGLIDYLLVPGASDAFVPHYGRKLRAGAERLLRNK